MDNENKSENKFFTYLQKQFSINDLVNLDERYVPKGKSTKINRFYSRDNPIWFSRQKINEGEKIYYFGLNKDLSPKLIFKFNNELNKSSIKFIKDNVLLLVKITDSKVFNEIFNHFKLKYATKDKSSNFFYLVLGNIDSKDLFNNIRVLVQKFSFEINLNKKAIRILDYIENDDLEESNEFVSNVNYREVLELNLKIIEVKNKISKKGFSHDISKRLNEFLFEMDNKGNYSFNPNFRFKFDMDIEEIFNALNFIIPDLDNSISFETIVDNIVNNVQKSKEHEEPDLIEEVEDTFTVMEKMDIVIEAFREGQDYDMAAKLAGISSNTIFEWYEDGENKKSKETIYFFNKINEIMFESLDEEDTSLQPQIDEDGEDSYPSSEDTGSTDSYDEYGDDSQTSDNESTVHGFNSTAFIPGKDVYQEVKEKFPLKSPRQDQLEIISEVAYAINKGYKYIILEAGTGTGKSAIAATLARIYENSYILTVTKQLQNQYYEDFKKYGFKLVKGRQNFKCIHHKKITCDKGDCVLKNKSCDYNLTSSNPLHKLQSACQGYFWKSETHCPYWVQKADAVNSKVTIANYDFGLYDFNLSHYFKKRKLLILDEAHNLENKIMSFISLDLNRKTLKKDIGIDLDYRAIDKLQKGNASDWINFVRHVKEKYDERAKILINQARSAGEDEAFIKDLEKELKIESANRERFIRYIGNDKKNWICDYNDKQEILSFKPLSIKNYTHDYLFGFGDVCIFMSATILNHKKFAEWMGVDINKVYSIKKDSPFNSSDNPIIIKDSFNMSRNYLRSSAPKTISVLNEILSKHKNEKGLIHTVSGDCRKYIMRNIKDDRLMTHTTKNRNKKLEEYKSSSNSVLVSPSMSEGVDLPGEQCRFQVIYKLPYMTLSEQVRQRLNEDEEWYDYRTSIALVQTFGRGIRYEGDYCTTYVIDSRFKEFIKNDKQNNHFIPDYVLKAIK